MYKCNNWDECHPYIYLLNDHSDSQSSVTKLTCVELFPVKIFCDTRRTAGGGHDAVRGFVAQYSPHTAQLLGDTAGRGSCPMRSWRMAKITHKEYSAFVKMTLMPHWRLINTYLLIQLQCGALKPLFKRSNRYKVENIDTNLVVHRRSDALW